MNTGKRIPATPAPQTIELIRRLLEAAHRPEPANDPVNSPNHYTRSHPGMECIDLNWNRLPPGNKAIYRNRVRTIIKTIQDKGTAE